MTPTGWLALGALGTLVLVLLAATVFLARRLRRSRNGAAELRDKLAGQTSRFKELGIELKRLKETYGNPAGSLPRIQRSVDSLLRIVATEPEDLPYPQRLTARRFGILSQGEEDGVIWAILGSAGIEHRRFVELGCGDNGGNSGFLATEAGWTGLMVDGSEQLVNRMRTRLRGQRTRVIQAWIDRDGVNDLIRENGLDGEIDLLSLDIDGNDYWVLEALDACSPRVLALEYNTAFGPDASTTVAYDPGFVRDTDVLSGLYYGASITALTRLSRKKGYRLVAGENVNAFYVRDDVAPSIPTAGVEDVYKAYAKESNLVAELDVPLFNAFERAGLELVEIPD